jgi:hypothetical protein
VLLELCCNILEEGSPGKDRAPMLLHRKLELSTHIEKQHCLYIRQSCNSQGHSLSVVGNTHWV